jgi:hypothetical protein
VSIADDEPRNDHELVGVDEMCGCHVVLMCCDDVRQCM